MASNFTDKLKSLEGVTDFECIVSSPVPEDEGVQGYNGKFKFRDLIMTYQQIVSANLTMNMLNVSFVYPTSKKQQKLKLLETLNSFNESRPAIKASLKNNSDKGFSVNFSMEFICPDEIINLSVVDSVVRVLSSSGSLLKGTFGRHGITLALKK
ncbi:hypothetical protein H8S66_22100 [Pseudomonas lurida]|uniref:hypothetical protein n=1 Tax=Pseudomonas lurida TaxID=244566 RepID=UPI001654122D|nr:hypothetical protein [Pseudomonas lurida]MBC3925582.1 hypothetical protein [Pseudomonas lurida]